jgi:uncharacterized protein YndB with AHSA1/START domain
MNATDTAVEALVINRTFDAPRERVFAAFTDPQLVMKWFGGKNTTVHGAVIDARVGGRYRIEMSSSEGEAYNVGGVFSEYSPVDRLAYTFRWEEDKPEDERDTRISIDFIDRGAQTEMIFTHENLASEASRERHTEGWNASFDVIGTLLA